MSSRSSSSNDNHFNYKKVMFVLLPLLHYCLLEAKTISTDFFQQTRTGAMILQWLILSAFKSASIQSISLAWGLLLLPMPSTLIKVTFLIVLEFPHLKICPSHLIQQDFIIWAILDCLSFLWISRLKKILHLLLSLTEPKNFRRISFKD